MGGGPTRLEHGGTFGNSSKEDGVLAFIHCCTEGLVGSIPMVECSSWFAFSTSVISCEDVRVCKQQGAGMARSTAKHQSLLVHVHHL